jgi:hypothetical protein
MRNTPPASTRPHTADASTPPAAASTLRRDDFKGICGIEHTSEDVGVVVVDFASLSLSANFASNHADGKQTI